MLIIGIAGTELSAQERDWLHHPSVAGVILFKRNFASREQVTDLAAAIRAAVNDPSMRARATELAEQITQEDGATRASAQIESALG